MKVNLYKSDGWVLESSSSICCLLKIISQNNFYAEEVCLGVTNSAPLYLFLVNFAVIWGEGFGIYQERCLSTVTDAFFLTSSLFYVCRHEFAETSGLKS